MDTNRNTGRVTRIYDAADRERTGDDTDRNDWEESSKVGTGAGTAAGVVAGAAAGSVAGPVGTAIGGIAGAAVGAGVGAAGDVAGEETEDALDGDNDRAVGTAGSDTSLRDEHDINTKGVTPSETRKGQVDPA